MNQQWAGYDYTQYAYDTNGQPTGYYDSAGIFHYYDYSQYYQGQDYTAAETTPNSNTQSESFYHFYVHCISCLVWSALYLNLLHKVLNIIFYDL